MGPLLGPGCLLVTRFRGREALEALVLREPADGARPAALDHYRRSLSRPDRPWVRLGTVTDSATGPGVLLRQGGLLRAVLPEASGTVAYVLGDAGWQPGPGPAPLPARPGGRPVPGSVHGASWSNSVRAGGRERALTEEGGSVFDQVRHSDGSWERNGCLRLSGGPFRVAPTESVKLAQVTGDRDATATPWGERAPTLSASPSTAGVRGTDLGVRVEHEGRSFLLFGDTHWSRRPWLATRDAIAEVLPGAAPEAPGLLPPGLPGVRFSGAPLALVGRRAGRVTVGEYDVPLDGFSLAGRLYVFFSTNHFREGRVMGRSVLARAVEASPVIDPARRRPVRFEVLGEFSSGHFITVSVQWRPAGEVPGLDGDGDVVLVWGTGPYRASEPRLAVLDQPALAALLHGAAPRARYWDGSGWSPEEADARPLFAPAALGELSVRWVPAAGRYLMLTASAPEDPIGPAVELRTASSPQGPWSTRLRLLDWVATGMSLDPHTRFIRSPAGEEVGDRMFRAQARATGAAYAPHLFDARLDGDDLVLRYTLSTWNPYQVVLMQHRLAPPDLTAPLTPLPHPSPAPLSSQAQLARGGGLWWVAGEAGRRR